MEKLIEKLIGKMFDHERQDEDENRAIYQYGLLVGSEFMIFLLLFLLICGMLHMFIEGMIFLMVFAALRSYTGGFHLERYSHCLILSCSVVVLILLGVKYVDMPVYVLLGAVGVFTAVIWNMGPVGEDDISERTFYYDKIKKCILGIVILTLIFWGMNYVKGIAVIAYTLGCIVLSLCGVKYKKLLMG